MNYNMRVIKLLAENLQGFLDLVNRTYRDHAYFVPNYDMLYRLYHLVDESKFQIYIDEMIRLGKYPWKEKEILRIVKRIEEKIIIIDEFIGNNYDDLFLFSGRVHGIRTVIDSLQ